MAKQIALTQGKYAIVDDDDFERANRHRWYAKQNKQTYYAGCYYAGKRLLLHRFILNAPPSLIVDHINGNGLDCRRANLRLCDHDHNKMNRRIEKTNRSGYRGVSWNTKKKCWEASIQCARKKHHAGYYNDKIDAARAYDEKARELFGEFANTNF